VPTGIQRLLGLARENSSFREKLLVSRADAANSASVFLTESEKLVLGAVPTAQLERMISHTPLASRNRRRFVSQVGLSAAALLGGVGAIGSMTGCDSRPERNEMPSCGGIAPDDPSREDAQHGEDGDDGDDADEAGDAMDENDLATDGSGEDNAGGAGIGD